MFQKPEPIILDMFNRYSVVANEGILKNISVACVGANIPEIELADYRVDFP